MPAISNFQTDDDRPRSRRAPQEDGDHDEEYRQENEEADVTDPSLLDFQNQGYPELERDAEDFFCRKSAG